MTHLSRFALVLSVVLLAFACGDEASSEAFLDLGGDTTAGDVAVAKDESAPDAPLAETQDTLAEDLPIQPESCIDNPGGFGCSCVTGSDCSSNFCVQGFE